MEGGRRCCDYGRHVDDVTSYHVIDYVLHYQESQCEHGISCDDQGYVLVRWYVDLVPTRVQVLGCIETCFLNSEEVAFSSRS